MSELDDQFGIAIPPQHGGLRNWEVRESVTCYELNQATASTLNELFAAAERGPLGLFILEALTILWAVKENGEIVFALEETVDLKRTFARRPRMRGIPLNPNVKPLGHPLLVGGQAARIAGEIYVDYGDDGQLTWVLNNKSGRYGIHSSRSINHLENVAAEFRRHRLRMEIDFFKVGT